MMSKEDLLCLYRSMYRYLRGLGFSHDEAEEILQRVMLVLVRRFREGAVINDWERYAWGVLFRVLQEDRRRRTRDKERQGSLESKFPKETTKFSPPDALLAISEFQRGFQSLSAEEQDVLWLRFVEGFSQEKCAEILEITRYQIREFETSGKGKLRRCLKAPILKPLE